MSVKIKVIDGKKGSNPGGVGLLSCRGPSVPLKVYFKYCHSSRVGASNLSVKNQPIYEAITLNLARALGLKTPDFFVLMNPDGDVAFENWKAYGLSNPSGRPSYFVSKLVERNTLSQPKNVEELEKEVLERDKVYLESLLIDDIFNKRQNYLYNGVFGPDSIGYVDLGCSFVRAVDGAISIPSKLKLLEPKQRKRLEKRLKGVHVISADNASFVSLEELASSVFGMEIPTLNSNGGLNTHLCLSEEEKEEIHGYVLQGLCDSVGEYKKRGLLVNAF